MVKIILKSLIQIGKSAMSGYLPIYLKFLITSNTILTRALFLYQSYISDNVRRRCNEEPLFYQNICYIDFSCQPR